MSDAPHMLLHRPRSHEAGNYSNGGAGRGCPATDPRVLLALWLYATMEGVGSARALDRLTQSVAALVSSDLVELQRVAQDRMSRTRHPDFFTDLQYRNPTLP